MDAEILARLNGINQEFYQIFAGSFSQTRQRIQPGVSQILTKIQPSGNYLDIGCGNGGLAREWLRRGFRGSFIGVDFSPGLIAAAQQTASSSSPDQTVCFYHADLSVDNWAGQLPAHSWDHIFCFAVLHHIPGAAQRLRLCQQIQSLVSPVTEIWISVWQPLNSLRLKQRILDWEAVGIDSGQVEVGDVLIDWRAQTDAEKQTGLRYVHIFDEKELSELAQASGFKIEESYSSDGREGNLGLYQKWWA